MVFEVFVFDIIARRADGVLIMILRRTLRRLRMIGLRPGLEQLTSQSNVEGGIRAVIGF